MNSFTRNNNPKGALRIGIRLKAYEILKRIVDENMFVMPYNSVRERMERDFLKEVGLRLKIDFNNDAGFSFFILFPEDPCYTNVTHILNE